MKGIGFAPLATMDALWANLPAATLFWSVTSPDVAELHDAVAELDDRLPDAPFRGTSPGIPILASDATSFDGLTGDAGRAFHHICAGAPLAIIRAEHGLAVAYNHGLGDLTALRPLVAAVLGGGAGTAPVPERGRARQLAAVLARHAAASPAGLRDLATSFGRRTVLRASNQDFVPATLEAALDDTVVVSHRLPRAEVAELRRWRDDDHPTVSMSMLWLHRLAEELADRGISGQSMECRVMVDLRRYDPALAGLGGNLVGSVSSIHRQGDPAERLHEELTRDIRSAEPLAAFLLNGLRLSARTLGRTAPHVDNTTPPRPRHPSVTWSDRGAMAAWEGLVPWAGPDREVRVFSPAVGNRIAVNLMELDGDLYVSATLDRSTFDERAVAGALRKTFGGPHALAGVDTCSWSSTEERPAKSA